MFEGMFIIQRTEVFVLNHEGTFQLIVTESRYNRGGIPPACIDWLALVDKFSQNAFPF